MAASIVGCKHKNVAAPTAVVEDKYPEAIRTILINKCATAGCHNASSYTGAGGLLLDSWEHLFEGGSNGAVAVPFNAENSSLLYFINTYPELGTTAEPVMPYNETPLSKEEYITIRDWIEKGAPDKDGNIPFATNAAGRQKIYAVQQGCDLVAVIDAEKNVVMRYIKVGVDYGTENPNNVVVSPDGKYAYVSFWNAPIIQKIDTDRDSVVATLSVPRAFQKAIALNSDGTRLIACNWYAQDIILIDATNMQILNNYGRDVRFVAGFTADNAGGFYATSQFGNTVYQINSDGSYRAISIDGQPTVQETLPGTPDPYSVLLSPQKDKYFVTCTNTDEVRILSAANDELLYTIPVGHNPQLMVTSGNRLYVSCMNDTNSRLDVGSVYVIDYTNGTVEKKITDQFFQPYGLAADERNGLLYIFSRNEDKNGPPPHHSSPCNGRNGFYQVYDMSTLAPYTGKRFEVTVDPYSAAIRFKP